MLDTQSLTLNLTRPLHSMVIGEGDLGVVLQSVPHAAAPQLAQFLADVDNKMQGQLRLV